MAYNMLGKANLPPKAAPKPKPVSKTEAKQQTTLRATRPEDVMAMNRVKRLTAPTDGWSKHDTQTQYVHDVLNHGVNALEDRGDVSRDITARAYGELHKASLHLNSHAREHSKGNYGDAAAHLEIASKHLSNVAGTLSTHMGTEVTHGGDGQSYSLSFMKTHARTLANHYRTSVAGITAPTAQVPKRDYEPETELRIPEQPKLSQEQLGNEAKMYRGGKLAPGYLDSTFRELSEKEMYGNRRLTPAQRAKGPTNRPVKRALSPGEEKLGFAPEMNYKDHMFQAAKDLIAKGKIHPKQLAVLKPEHVDELYRQTGAER